MLEDILFGGGFMSASNIETLVYENADSFGVSFSQEKIIAAIAENIFLLLKDTLNLRIISEKNEWWGI